MRLGSDAGQGNPISFNEQRLVLEYLGKPFSLSDSPTVIDESCAKLNNPFFQTFTIQAVGFLLGISAHLPTKSPHTFLLLTVYSKVSLKGSRWAKFIFQDDWHNNKTSYINRALGCAGTASLCLNLMSNAMVRDPQRPCLSYQPRHQDIGELGGTFWSKNPSYASMAMQNCVRWLNYLAIEIALFL